MTRPSGGHGVWVTLPPDVDADALQQDARRKGVAMVGDRRLNVSAELVGRLHVVLGAAIEATERALVVDTSICGQHDG